MIWIGNMCSVTNAYRLLNVRYDCLLQWCGMETADFIRLVDHFSSIDFSAVEFRLVDCVMPGHNAKCV